MVRARKEKAPTIATTWPLLWIRTSHAHVRAPLAIFQVVLKTSGSEPTISSQNAVATWTVMTLISRRCP